MAKGDKLKTVSRARFSLNEWFITPFELSGTSAAFQRLTKKLLGSLLGDTCAAYLDEFVIFSNGTLDDYWKKVNNVLIRLAKASLKLVPQKYEFANKETKYLGFIIKVGEGIKVEPNKLHAITSWNLLKKIKKSNKFS